MRLLAVLAYVPVVAAVAAGCGDDGGNGGTLTVFAAASLSEAFARLPADARFNFAGSDELAGQLREGAEADVYAAADVQNASELQAAGLVREPRVFATNRLVLVVPRDNPARIASVDDLRGDGVKLVLGAEGVPVGDYARRALAALGASDVLENAVSHEEDVKGVVGKVASGEADAGFVYASDVRAAGTDLRPIELPAGAQPNVRYAIAVVAKSDRRDEAERFVALVLADEGRQALREAGFGVP